MKIGLDAGHRSTTPGKRTPPMPCGEDIDANGSIDIQPGEQYHEHYAAVGICVRLRVALERCGFEVVPVAWNDADATDDETLDDLGDRQQYVKDHGCDILISNHFNASGDGATFNSAAGLETYYQSDASRSGESQRLAEYVQADLIAATGQVDRGVKTDDFAMCDCVAMQTWAAILIEYCFMTSLQEAENDMEKASYWKIAAEAVCKGICEFTGTAYIAENTTAQTPEAEKNEMANLTQEQFNTFMDAWKKENDPNYPTLADVPPEWQDDVEALMAAGIINGGTDAATDSNDVNLTRAELKAIIIAYRLFKSK